jgi:hypothetical protein
MICITFVPTTKANDTFIQRYIIDKKDIYLNIVEKHRN